jgi:hypothetical protein
MSWFVHMKRFHDQLDMSYYSIEITVLIWKVTSYFLVDRYQGLVRPVGTPTEDCKLTY